MPLLTTNLVCRCSLAQLPILPVECLILKGDIDDEKELYVWKTVHYDCRSRFNRPSRMSPEPRRAKRMPLRIFPNPQGISLSQKKGVRRIRSPLRKNRKIPSIFVAIRSRSLAPVEEKKNPLTAKLTSRNVRAIPLFPSKLPMPKAIN